MKGFLIDLSTGKQYPATFDVGDGGSTITMKLKASFVHFSTTWKKQCSL